MKHLKVLGLAAIAAVALMAFLGADMASATVLCKNNLNTEACSEPYKAGEKGKASLASGATALFESTAGTTEDTCTGSNVESTLENAGSSTTTVKSGISTLTLSGCTSVTKVLAGGFAELHWISGTDNGTLTTIGTEVTFLISGLSCIYGASTGVDVGTTLGGNPGSLTINAVFPKVGGGFLCPSDGIFQGKYVPTEPTAGWVAAG